LNKVIVADEDGFATTELVPLKCNPAKVLPSYLAHFLRSPGFLDFAKTVVSGAKMPRMVMSEFWKYRVPIPPLQEQRRVVTILDKTNTLRVKSQEFLRELDRMAQSIFFEMFGDQHLHNISPESVKLAELVNINPSITLHERKSLLNSEVSFLPMASICENDKNVIVNELRPYDLVAKGYTSFKRGDLLVAKITPCYENGKMAIASELLTEYGFGSTEFHVFRTTDERLCLFVFYLLKQAWVMEAGAKSMKGAAGQKRVPADFFSSLRVINPQPQALETFADRISKIECMKKSVKQSLLELDALFFALQHQAFSGAL